MDIIIVLSQLSPFSILNLNNLMVIIRRLLWDGLQRVANDDKESLEFLNDSFILKLENGETKIKDF